MTRADAASAMAAPPNRAAARLLRSCVVQFVAWGMACSCSFVREQNDRAFQEFLRVLSLAARGLFRDDSSLTVQGVRLGMGVILKIAARELQNALPYTAPAPIRRAALEAGIARPSRNSVRGAASALGVQEGNPRPWNVLSYLRIPAAPAVLIRRSPDMPIQIVMDRSGRHPIPVRSCGCWIGGKALRELTQRGFTAVALGKDGAANRVVKTFDPNIERTLFIPQLEGG